VYDREGTLIAEFYQEQRELISLEELPPELIEAIIAIEDRRFTRHNGIDFQGIFRAAIRNLQAGRIVEGGSTLTQQLAKVLFLTPKQTFKRKFEEALLALRIERHYTKKEILERYFNKVYFGAGAYGIQAASELYFGINARELNLPQAALLASLPRAPSYYSPLNDPDRVKERHRHILSLLAEEGWLEPDEVDQVFESFWEQYDPERHRDNFRQVRVHDSRYFVEEVRRRLVNRYGEERVYKGGLTVHTTLDREQQSLLEDEMHDLSEVIRAESPPF
jgi:penicillin-binding protein 1A